jgi:asparagine synthase (glutamine-hydrolysing)
MDPVTGHVIVFNGNFANCGGAWRPRGRSLNPPADTAVMLRALGLHGPGAVSWLRCMFTFACWDPK